MLENTKWVIRSVHGRRGDNAVAMLEDTKWVIRSRTWKKGRQCSGYVRRYQRSNQKPYMEEGETMQWLC